MPGLGPELYRSQQIQALAGKPYLRSSSSALEVLVLLLTLVRLWLLQRVLGSFSAPGQRALHAQSRLGNHHCLPCSPGLG